MKWLQKQIDKRVEEMLRDKVDQLIAEARHHLEDPIAIIEDEITMAKGATYTLLDTETDRSEIIDAWFDLSGFQDGDAADLSVDIRFSDGKHRIWRNARIEGLQAEAAFRLDRLMAPRGAKITIVHRAGNEVKIRWFIRRAA